MTAQSQSGESAAIEYVGVAGASKECVHGVLRYLQYGDDVSSVRILTNPQEHEHCLLLTVGPAADYVAVKSGFGSGYLGEGSRSFSYVLHVLDTFGVAIDEIEVAKEVVTRVDAAALTEDDLDGLLNARAVRPTRWHDYVQERHWGRSDDGMFFDEFPYVIPFAIVDSRLSDLAIGFWAAPDSRLLDAYRRLEDIVRSRTGLSGHGARLFSDAFVGKDARLTWPGDGGAPGKGQLFVSAFGGFRNPRAHRESVGEPADQLAEFLLVNQLFRLEKLARESDFAS